MTKKRWIALGCVIFLFITIVVVAVRVTRPFTLRAKEVMMNVPYDNYELAGSLYLPENHQEDEAYSVVILLHGDGAVNRTSNDEYTILMNQILDQGVAVFSYDKAGVGNSGGDWHYQDMAERAKEAIAVKAYIQDNTEADKIGFFGFSQGGWVLSEIALATTDYDFMMLIGGAINWMDQGEYIEKTRIDNSDMSETDKQNYYQFSEATDEFLLKGDYEGYLEYMANNPLGLDVEATLNEDRFWFIHFNMESDATEGIYAIKSPFLGLFGEKDMNVNGLESYETYLRIFEETDLQEAEVYLVEDGNHSLIKAEYDPLIGQQPSMLKLLWAGEGIYAEGVLEILSDFVALHCQ